MKNFMLLLENMFLYNISASGIMVKKKIAIEEAKNMPATPKKRPIIIDKAILTNAVTNGIYFNFFKSPRVERKVNVVYWVPSI